MYHTYVFQHVGCIQHTHTGGGAVPRTMYNMSSNLDLISNKYFSYILFIVDSTILVIFFIAYEVSNKNTFRSNKSIITV